jgi:cellulose synthase/poly-beta-1,6-N-acetylglucosamine synthase-like glycosyltransferase
MMLVTFITIRVVVLITHGGGAPLQLKTIAQAIGTSIHYSGKNNLNISKTFPVRFTVGICASDESPNLVSLLDLVCEDEIPEGFVLSRIIVVASACSKKTLDYIRRISERDNRLLVFEEAERHGKAEALNKIFERREGDFLVLINADALPSSGSISKLLMSIARNESVGIASARPFFENKKGGILAKIQELMWSVHNESSLLLNHMGISNHSNDEMMVVRAELLESLPYGLVNDGAFIAGRAKENGYSVRFCENAQVKIEVPSAISDNVEQRRRVIFGHFQVRKLVGRSPTTVESMLLSSPFLSLWILVRTLAKSPRYLGVLPIAVAGEILALVMALVDLARSTDKHRIWKRYER